ncbi:hypothetical protein [Leptothermofonsia sp. ETS-13]|uniref:hypothetical protein n=1 Tax=Leptothermofonsia sp. ETS-13 TaxID=3035696 RepID=UPI003B9E5069
MVFGTASKRLKVAVFSFALTVPLAVMAGCATQQPTQTSSPSPTETGNASADKKGQRLAVVLPGLPNDQSWDQAAYDAAQALKAKGVDVAIAESVSPADAPRVLRQFADAGYTTIVAHSFNF